MLKLLKIMLVLVGFMLPATAILDRVFFTNSSFFFADVVSILRFLALGLLCLFAAHKIEHSGSQQ